MTTLVIDPGNLAQLHQDASISNPKRLRIIAQVVHYSDGTLTVCGLPGLVDGKTPLKIDVSLVELDHELTYSGTVVNLEGLYDSTSFNVFTCYAVNSQCLLDNVYLSTLKQMASLSG